MRNERRGVFCERVIALIGVIAIATSVHKHITDLALCSVSMLSSDCYKYSIAAFDLAFLSGRTYFGSQRTHSACVCVDEHLCAGRWQ